MKVNSLLLKLLCLSSLAVMQVLLLAIGCAHADDADLGVVLYTLSDRGAERLSEDFLTKPVAIDSLVQNSTSGARAELVSAGFVRQLNPVLLIKAESTPLITSAAALTTVDDMPPDMLHADEVVFNAQLASSVKGVMSPKVLLAQYVMQTLQQNPQIFQSEAESRAADNRLGEAREGFAPRVTVSGNLARERQEIDTTHSNANFNQISGQLRMTLPLFDSGLKAQISQRLAASVGSDWRLVDIREQLMLRTIEAYVELVRNTNLVRLAQKNLNTHRQYVSQMKEIALADLGRTSDLPVAIGRVALAEAVLTSRLAKLENARVSWRQLTGVDSPLDFVEVPQIKLPETLGVALAHAIESNPVIELALADVETARKGIDLAISPYTPKVNLEMSAKAGNDFGGVVGPQRNAYAGVSFEWNIYSGKSESYATKAANEAVLAAQYGHDRIRNELRARVEQTWYDLQSGDASLRSFEQYARNSELMVEATKNQFKIGRKSLLEVLNAENELFTANSNIESSLQDIKVAAWRLHSLQGYVQAELGLK